MTYGASGVVRLCRVYQCLCKSTFKEQLIKKTFVCRQLLRQISLFLFCLMESVWDTDLNNKKRDRISFYSSCFCRSKREISPPGGLIPCKVEEGPGGPWSSRAVTSKTESVQESSQETHKPNREYTKQNCS